MRFEQKIALAKHFHALVRKHLVEHLEDIDATNVDDSDVCATHDYCDANMLMAAAFEYVFGREVDIQSDSDLNMWSLAWDLAKHKGFSRVWTCEAC